ncbi:MarR family winged helix-turn-helix transcriptional regulator [Microlunatus sp. Gsoil 973]|uniref:MarR family winged helix-turn-helix transcriptional regulator n=1 Tax=Microlunatus sp. Gsoil 973 TaxID=2672569 RepID=UPI0018A7ECB0|nr:MarR family transcriptional regulator [Microlunatus sp. Gsoil 973]
MTDTPGIDTVLGGQFYLAHRYSRAASNAALKSHGIDLRHLGVLADLAEHSPSKQRELVERVQLDKTSLVYVLDQLERLGCAERRPDPTDRRSHAVVITPKGRRLLRAATTTVDQTMRGLFEGVLPPRDKQQLSRLLGKLLAGLADNR